MSLREKAIDRLIKLKELGITESDIDAMEKQMSQTHSVPDMKEADLLPPISPFDNLSDEEILYYATPYYDELQAKKELQATASKGDN